MPKDTKLSLSESHSSVDIPKGASGMFRRFIAFGGPAYLISVGYVDPGNWATDLEGGSRFGYDLLWVLVMANAMAILLQTLAARLGIVTGRDLAQACREHYSKRVSVVLWILCEIAIAACDLAEVLGTAIALNLLFGIALINGVLITGLDVLLVLGLRQVGMRKLEIIILSFVFIIGASFFVELFLAHPSAAGIIHGLIPKLDHSTLFIAIGILGATVMPHNLYLHSSLVQTRRFDVSDSGKAQACKYNFWDSFLALNGALFINAAILILAAAIFFSRGIVVTEIQQAHQLLTPLLGNSIGSILFAIALLASGQSSTITGTLAGQIVMEGFIDFKMSPPVRRLITRSLAIIPAALVIWLMGDKASYQLLLLSQVILSMQLAFAIVPLIHFTSDATYMGRFANKGAVKILAWIVALVIIGLNVQLLISALSSALADTGAIRIVALVSIPILISLAIFLLYISFAYRPKIRSEVTQDETPEADIPTPAFRRIGVALERMDTDRSAINRALMLAKSSGVDATIVLIHVSVSGPSRMLGSASADRTVVLGEEYLASQRKSLEQKGNVTVLTSIGFGSAAKEILRIAKEEQLDVLVMAAHGHRGLKDVVLGTTISAVRHALPIPILVTR